MKNPNGPSIEDVECWKQELEDQQNREAYFACWWSVHHPFDWWSNERDGEPLPNKDRLLVWAIAKLAFEAGKELERNNWLGRKSA